MDLGRKCSTSDDSLSGYKERLELTEQSMSMLKQTCIHYSKAVLNYTNQFRVVGDELAALYW